MGSQGEPPADTEVPCAVLGTCVWQEGPFGLTTLIRDKCEAVCPLDRAGGWAAEGVARREGAGTAATSRPAPGRTASGTSGQAPAQQTHGPALCPSVNDSELQMPYYLDATSP